MKTLCDSCKKDCKQPKYVSVRVCKKYEEDKKKWGLDEKSIS